MIAVSVVIDRQLSKIGPLCLTYEAINLHFILFIAEVNLERCIFMQITVAD